MDKLLDFSPFVLVGATIVLAIVDLRKDWDEYKKPWLKIIALSALCIVAILTFVSVYQDRKDKRAGRDAAEELQGEVVAANTAQTNNTSLFLKKFSELSKQVADLQTEAKTDALQKKLASVQAELQNTQKALDVPKAKLAFTFWPFKNPPLGSGLPIVLSTDVTLPVDDNGDVHVDFAVINLSDVSAVDGDITLVICDLCKYAKGPDGFTKKTGLPETQRIRPFHHIDSKSYDGTLSVDLSVPPSAGNMTIGISYRCTNCVVPIELSNGLVRLKRDFRKAY